MTCVHKVRWSVKRPEKCRFGLSVSHYKDRIVAPDEYSGATVVTPSDSEQVLQTKDKLVRDDITVEPAPTESLATSENGTFFPSSGNVGFSSVTVDVEPALESLSITENGLYLPDVGVDGFDRVSVDVPATGYDKGTLIYEGDFSAVTSQWNVTELPNGQAFAFDKIEVELSGVGAGINTNWRSYFRSDLPMTGNTAQTLNVSNSSYISGATACKIRNVMEAEGDYISARVETHDTENPTATKTNMVRIAHGGYDKITGYGWWSWNCPAGAHIRIVGYNRTS